MPVHRERTDPVRTPAQLEVCHRRWLLPDDVARAVPLPQAARLWRGLIDLGVLDPSSEAELDRLALPAAGGEDHTDLPAPARALATLKVENFDPAECPLCRAGSVAVKPGSHFVRANA